MVCESGPSNITDWGAIVVALLALGAAIWQGIISRRHNRISVTPMIVHHVDTDIRRDGISVSIKIRNVGSGTALVTDRYFLLRGERFIPRTPNHLIKEIVEATIGKALHYQIVTSGMFGPRAKIPAGAEITLATVFFPGLHPDAQETIEALTDKADFVVAYKCLYGETYTYHSNE